VVYPVIEGAKEDQPELDFAAGEDGPEDVPLKRGKAKAGLLFKEVAPAPSLKAATEMYQELKGGPLKGLRLGLLHGRMDADEKEISMRRFQRREVDVLISTTVIEVGVDVPNATVMIVEHAERFGLAQLHQLRGRVGRGERQSFCMLLHDDKIGITARKRLNTLRQSEDGFFIADEDFLLRGAGDVLGTKQSGLPGYLLADADRDEDLLPMAKQDAELLLQRDPKLESERGQAMRVLLNLFDQRDAIQTLRAG
jgi:ATP-dependent DNA helicase RecG